MEIKYHFNKRFRDAVFLTEASSLTKWWMNAVNNFFSLKNISDRLVMLVFSPLPVLSAMQIFLGLLWHKLDAQCTPCLSINAVRIVNQQKTCESACDFSLSLRMAYVVTGSADCLVYL